MSGILLRALQRPGWLAPEGHYHLAEQPCFPTSCEPVERLRCRCTWPFTNGEPSICHVRATQEDGLCDDCRERCVP